MKLYTYWRSSAAYRVRIALALKGLAYEGVPVHLVRDGGEHLKPVYESLNPQKQVPTLVLDDETVLIQSMAILEYLEETWPKPSLLPTSSKQRAWVRSLCQLVVSDIHPLNNLKVLSYLKNNLGVEDEPKTDWYSHWIRNGFSAFEALLRGSEYSGEFCHGDTPTMADLCLIPQLYNARRFEVDLSPYPTIRRIEENCQSLEAFSSAAPEQQADAA